MFYFSLKIPNKFIKSFILGPLASGEVVGVAVVVVGIGVLCTMLQQQIGRGPGRNMVILIEDSSAQVGRNRGRRNVILGKFVVEIEKSNG